MSDTVGGVIVTDLEMLKATFDKLGIEYEIIDMNNGNKFHLCLKIEKGVGYSCHVAEFYFDEVDNFVNFGVWEE